MSFMIETSLYDIVSRVRTGGYAVPKQTFFNLPEDKKNKLIESAELEFTRVPLFEASIANIIKTAGIPRGSFYQYFEDKEDLYFYILDGKLKKAKVGFINLLKKHNGDLIKAFMEMYYRILVAIPDEEEKNFLKNAILHTSHRVESSFASMIDANIDNQEFKEIIGLINKDSLNMNEDKELLQIFKIISALAFHNFIEKILKGLSDDEAMETFTLRMDLIKQGISKKK